MTEQERLNLPRGCILQGVPTELRRIEHQIQHLDEADVTRAEMIQRLEQYARIAAACDEVDSIIWEPLHDKVHAEVQRLLSLYR